MCLLLDFQKEDVEVCSWVNLSSCLETLITQVAHSPCHSLIEGSYILVLKML